MSFFAEIEDVVVRGMNEVPQDDFDYYLMNLDAMAWRLEGLGKFVRRAMRDMKAAQRAMKKTQKKREVQP
jgi:hypothetical protein